MSHTPTATRGFTLIEVLVALAVVALSLGALWHGFSQALAVSQQLPERVVARWVAENRAVVRQSEAHWPEARTYTGQTDMAGRTWYWEERIEATDEPRMRRLAISVGLDPQRLSLFHLEAYLARPNAPEPQIGEPAGSGTTESWS